MKISNKTTVFVALGTLVLGMFMGWVFFRNPAQSAIDIEQDIHDKNTIWTCSMHPHIRQSEPGQCLICGMDLIPLKKETSSDKYPMDIYMSPTAMQLANVQTSVISKQKPVKEVRMNGKIKADERRIFSQSSHIPGRIEKLLVNFTGEKINAGQIVAYIYSPDLVTGQRELFEAYKIRESQPGLYKAARQKLINWKLTEKQIDNIVQTGHPQEKFPIRSDVSGVILNRRVALGDYVNKGQSLFEVVDLSKVWVLFDVYENDLSWVRKNDEVTYTIPSFPGERFTGRISFIDPIINPKTRAATARIEQVNHNGLLKPGMFAVGIVKSPSKTIGEEIIVPKSAVMWTGRRSVVYVKRTSTAGISFAMRQVTLGDALGDTYIIKEGLEAGEEIATHGTFSIDAAAQLAGKPSMMNPEGGVAMTGHNHGGESNRGNSTSANHSKTISINKKAKAILIPLFDNYFVLKDALVNDDFDASLRIGNTLQSDLSKINMSAFKGDAHGVWMKHSTKMAKALESLRRAKNIGDVRKYFKSLSDQFVMLAVTFGPFNNSIFIQNCPMANNNKGADWLSAEKEIKNPYFGESMIGCGEVTKEIK